MSAAGGAFVTPHAVRQFQERVAPGLTYEQALGAILRGLERPANTRPLANGTGWRVRVRRPWPFRAVVRPDPAGRLPVVVTVLRSGR